MASKQSTPQNPLKFQIHSIVLVVLFVVIMWILVLFPIIALFVKSFTRNNFMFLELLDFGLLKDTIWTLGNYVKIITDSYYLSAFYQTFFIAFLGVGFSALIGIPVAYYLTRSQSQFSRFARLIITLPIFVPDIVILFSLLVFLSRQGIVNFFLGFAGLHQSLIYNIPGVIIGTFYILFSPFVVIVAATMERLDWSLVEASYTLGESELSTFWRIVLPLTTPGIFAGAILTFSSAIGFVAIAMILGGGTAAVRIIPLEIMDSFSTFGADIPLGAAMASLLLIVTLISQWIANRIRPANRG